jgi:hypothetical protein
MQIFIELESQGEDLTALQVARFLSDLQNLVVFGIALAHDDIHAETDLLSTEQGSYESKISMDTQMQRGTIYPPEPLLFVKELRLNSPLTVKVGFFFRGTGKTLRGILEIFKTVITVDHVRRRAAIENGVRAQDIVRLQLENFEHALKIAQRIANPDERAAFERNMALAILPFVDGRYPPVKSLDIIEPT